MILYFFSFHFWKFFELKKNFLLLFFKHSQKLYLFCNKQNWCILFKITNEMHKSFLFFESVLKHLNCFLLKKQSLSVYLFHYFHSLQFVRSKVFPDSFEFFFGFLTFFGVYKFLKLQIAECCWVVKERFLTKFVCGSIYLLSTMFFLFRTLHELLEQFFFFFLED